MVLSISYVPRDRDAEVAWLKKMCYEVVDAVNGGKVGKNRDMMISMSLGVFLKRAFHAIPNRAVADARISRNVSPFNVALDTNNG